MSAPTFRPFVARLLLVALAPLALDGCVSIGLSRSAREAGPGPTGELAVAVFRKPSDRDNGVLVGHPVLAELQRVEGGSRTTVARSMSASWSLRDLPPGRYALNVTRKIDEKGDVVPLKKPSAREFDIRAGERVQAAVVLEKVPVGLIIFAAITLILLVVLAFELADEVKLPPPPPLPFADVFVGVALELPFRVASGQGSVAPGVADVFPAPGSVVAARRVAVSFFTTVPLAEDSLEEGAVLAVGSLSGEIPGEVSWLEEDRLLRFSPSVDFRPGEDVTVTLDLEKVESTSGTSGSGRVTTTFRVP